MPEKMRKAIGVILLVSLISTGFMSIVKEYISIPTNVAVFEKQKHSIDTSIEASANASSQAFSLSEKKNQLEVTGQKAGKAEIVYDFKGFPIKKTKVDVLPELKVVMEDNPLASSSTQ